MRFHAKYVSAAEAGEYYQLLFQTEDPGDDATAAALFRSN
jgi:hypothetical protein